MELLQDSKAVKGLQELITICARTTRTGREMILTRQIGEYEMDQVILNLGSDVNVLPKQTWESMGRVELQWSPIQL